MLIDVVVEKQLKVDAVEGCLKSFCLNVDQKVETPQLFISPPSAKDIEVMSDGVNALKKWTRKRSARVIFNSTIDEFTNQGLFDKVKCKRNVAVVGFTTDGDVFGGFYSVAVTMQSKHFKDPNIFIFSFESHGRCMTPQRFVLKKKKRDKAYVCFNRGSDNNGFVFFGCSGGFGLGNERSCTWCGDLSEAFEGIEDTTLTGQTNPGSFDNGQHHHCTRLIAVHLL